jgi:putative peptide maturation system protein
VLNLQGAFDAPPERFALVGAPGLGTVLLGAAPDDGVPWPMRGLRHAGEGVVLRVDGAAVFFEDMAAQLERLWDDPDLLDRLVGLQIVANEIAERDLTLTDADLQEGMDAFRFELGLLDETETQAWLSRRGWSTSKLEDLVGTRMLGGRLRALVVSDEEVDRAARNPDDYRQVSMVEAIFHQRGSAAEVIQAVEAGTPLSAAAHDHGRALGGVRARVRSWFELHDDEKAIATSAARVGLLDDRAADRQGYRLLQVTHVVPLVAPQAIRRLARERLFDAWIAARRSSAHIEWFWGRAREPVGR